MTRVIHFAAAIAAISLGLPLTEPGAAPCLTAATVRGLELRNLQDTFSSGRIADVAVDRATTASVWYVTTAPGGLSNHFGGYFGYMLTASPERMFQIQWPLLFSLLRTSAKRTLPTGLRDYVSGPEAAVGEAHLNSLESSVGELVSTLGHTEVADAYRRDLSAFTSERHFAEFACELSICTALSRVSEANSVKHQPTTMPLDRDPVSLSHRERRRTFPAVRPSLQ